MPNQSHQLFLDQLGAPPSRASTFPNTCIILSYYFLRLKDSEC